MTPSPEAKHIAIVDDEGEFAATVADMCHGLGFRTTVHRSAVELLDAQAPWTYGAILIDLSLPGVDGFELMRKLATRRDSSPVVLMSGFDFPVLKAAQEAGKALGVNVLGMLKKPFRLRELADLLARAGERPASAPALPGDIDAEELARGIAEDQIEVYMQPQVSLTDGRWTGMEALARWNHPTKGLLTPDRFIPLAEQSGQALALTRNVVQRALRIGRQARSRHGFEGMISVNLSPVSLTDAHFPDMVEGLLNLMGWSHGKFCFEVTETSVANNPVQALEILARLRLKGFSLSIDDFGTGHSSLENLSRIPVSELKIDMNFVLAAMTDHTAGAIVRNSLSLGHELGLTVVAEGVETAQHWHWLRQIGCDIAQGYLVARPLAPDALDAWPRRWSLPYPLVETACCPSPMGAN
jgi:EAL domain-containing protein (putative c-di-GMP-specific phosphodiesterase class I)/FixJ family two-component response regulator